MRIVIAGVGEVGSHLAKMLSGSGHDITVIDSDARLLSDVSSVTEVVTVEGDATTFSVLRRASVRKCDLYIAVSHVENDNILSAIMAKQLGARKAIARIDNDEYLEPNNKEMFINMGIDYLFYPEKVAAGEVVALLGHTAISEYVDFANGRLALVVFRLEQGSPLAGRKLGEFSNLDSTLNYRTVAITRGGQTIVPTSSDSYALGDTLYVIARQGYIDEVMSFSGRPDEQVRNMMILGGSRVGVRIASALEEKMNIKLVDYNADKAYRLAELLDKTLIINEDGRNTDAMLEEGLANMDAFVAVTGRSETNILSAMQAKKMGVRKVIAAVENLHYINLAESVGIDAIINKQLVTASNIFRFTMSTDVQSIKCLTGTSAEVLEFIVKPNSPATKHSVKDLGMPSGVIVGGVVRGNNAFIATGSTEIKAYDRVVVFALPAVINKVGAYFN